MERITGCNTHSFYIANYNNNLWAVFAESKRKPGVLTYHGTFGKINAISKCEQLSNAYEKWYRNPNNSFAHYNIIIPKMTDEERTVLAQLLRTCDKLDR